MRGDTDHIYDLVDENLNLRRAITIQDFERDWQSWPR
jgi:hypothetical protein